jgi:hypothetical protein
MKDEEAASYYRSMLNALAGLEDDLDANDAPDDAKVYLRNALRVCRLDYARRFGEPE